MKTDPNFWQAVCELAAMREYIPKERRTLSGVRHAVKMDILKVKTKKPIESRPKSAPIEPNTFDPKTCTSQQAYNLGRRDAMRDAIFILLMKKDRIYQSEMKHSPREIDLMTTYQAVAEEIEKATCIKPLGTGKVW